MPRLCSIVGDGLERLKSPDQSPKSMKSTPPSNAKTRVPFVTSSVLAPSSKARSPVRSVLAPGRKAQTNSLGVTKTTCELLVLNSLC